MFTLSVDDDKNKKKKEPVKVPALVAEEPISPEAIEAEAPIDTTAQRPASTFLLDPTAINVQPPSDAPQGTVAVPPPNVPVLDPTANPAGAINAAVTRVPQLLARNKELSDAMTVIQNMPITKQDGTFENPLAAVTKDPALLEAGKKLARNSRGKSALLGLIHNLSKNPRLANAKDWGDVAGGVAYGLGGLAGGAIHDTWDEEKKRGEIIGGMQEEIGRNEGQIKTEQQVANQNAQTAIRQQQVVLAGQRQKKQGEMIDSRITRNEMQNLSAEQKTVLDPIFKRGYFYEDDVDEATKARMKALGIVLADFDNRHKPVEQNGQWLEYNVETRRYEPVQGVPTDPDDVPMTMNVGGKTMTASAKTFLGYLGQKEGREFQAEQKEIDRKESLRRWAVENNISKTKFKADLDAKVTKGEMTQAQANAALADFPTDRP